MAALASEQSLLSTTMKSKPLHDLRIARQDSRPLGSMDMFHVLSDGAVTSFGKDSRSGLRTHKLSLSHGVSFR